MARPTQKIELGFGDNAPGNWFTLDNATRGVLDGTTYVLSGASYYDITQYVKNVSVSRGKNRELDRFNSGRINITVDNRTRIFDPTYVASPFYGQIVPRRDIRYTAGTAVQFTGIVDDWNLDYTPDRQSTASAVGYDGFALLAGQVLTGGTATSQLSGARINAVLNDAKVNWSATTRAIDAGQETLQADVIAAGQDVISYINTIEQTEPGVFFMDKKNFATFKDRASIVASSTAPILADDGSGIPYNQIKVVYGSELLYNQVIATRLNGGTATANDATSQAAYGIRTWELTGLLHNTDLAMANLAAYLVNQYSNPEFRFEAIEIVLNNLTSAQQTTLLNLEIGQVCNIVFTPNGIAPAINKMAEVLGISHIVDAEVHRMVLNFQTLDLGLFILDDARFGLLDLNSLGL
jgi:hypothetical protein